MEMKIESKPAEGTIVLRDVDINLTGGDTYPLTAYPKDDLTISPDGRIELRIAKSGEQIVVLAQHVRWYSVRERTVTVKDDAAAAYPSGVR
jgi:hypothetical protein